MSAHAERVPPGCGQWPGYRGNVSSVIIIPESEPAVTSTKPPEKKKATSTVTREMFGEVSSDGSDSDRTESYGSDLPEIEVKKTPVDGGGDAPRAMEKKAAAAVKVATPKRQELKKVSIPKPIPKRAIFRPRPRAVDPTIRVPPTRAMYCPPPRPPSQQAPTALRPAGPVGPPPPIQTGRIPREPSVEYDVVRQPDGTTTYKLRVFGIPMPPLGQ